MIIVKGKRIKYEGTEMELMIQLTLILIEFMKDGISQEKILSALNIAKKHLKED